MTTKIYLDIYMVQNQNFDNLRQSEHILSNFYFCEKAQLKQKAKLWLTGTDETRCFNVGIGLFSSHWSFP